MRTLLGILFQIFFTSFASGAFFIVSSVVAPIKPVIRSQATHLPRMSIQFSEYSLPVAALEDDYNVGEMEDESIPQDIPTRELRAGSVEIQFQSPVLRLPALKMQSSDLQELSHFQSPVSLPAEAAQQIRFNEEANLVNASLNQIQHHFWIEGKIELVDGLALSQSSDEIHVGWIMDEQIKTEGRVSIKEGRYSIKVSKLQGEIIAELTDKKGFVMGEATIDLDKILRERGAQSLVIDNVDLRLSPYSFGFRARTLSVYDSPTSKDPVVAANVNIGRHELSFPSNERGQIANESVSSKSTALLFADKKGYRDTVVIADFLKEQNLRMFPEKYIKALFDSVELPEEFRDLGVVWGNVVNRGVSAAGYKVRLAQHPEISAIYFESYIPILQNKETSPDGQYAIVGLSEGHYEIQVLDSLNSVIDTKLVYIKPGAISTIEFEVARTKTVYVKYFDPFRNDARAMEYVSLGHIAVTTETEKSIPITTYSGDDPLLLFSKLENATVESATFASRTRKYQEIPVLDHSWFDKIANQYKIQKKQGTIVGFVDTDEHFEVYLDKLPLDYKILYFDSRGEIIQAKDLGRQRAGFIFYNTTADLHTVLIETASGKMISELAYVDGESIALIYKAL